MCDIVNWPQEGQPRSVCHLNLKAGYRRLARSPRNVSATRKHARNETCVEVYSHFCGHFKRQISRVSHFELDFSCFVPEAVKLRNQRDFLAKSENSTNCEMCVCNSRAASFFLARQL